MLWVAALRYFYKTAHFPIDENDYMCYDSGITLHGSAENVLCAAEDNMEKKYKFRDGSLSFDERVKDLLSRLTIEEKAGLLPSHMAAVPRLDIGEWYVGAEVARGYVSRNPDEPTTVFPQPIGLSGTFDTELMEKAGLAAGKEARVLNKRHPSGHLMLWGPTVDLCRNPLWGRNEEGYGEDPFLTGEMSAAYTKGLADRHGEYLQSIPTLKHFCANNTENERGTASSDIEPRTLNEYYYAAFERPITCGGAYSIMAAYNELSGVPAVINPDIQKVLKDKWGLGFAVTDGGDFSQNVAFHGYSTSHAETIALAIKNGVDVMTDCEDVVAASALEAVKSGLVSEKDIDKALYNSLLARFRLGEFDEKHPFSDIDESVLDCEKHKKLNHRAALEQTVLLKNDGILPLATDKSVAVIGLNGNCNLMDWYTGYSSYNTTILDGVRSKFAKAEYDNACDHVVIKSELTGKYLGVADDDTVSAIYEKDNPRALFEKAEYGHDETTYRSLYNNKYITENSCKCDSESTYRWFSQEIMKPQKHGDNVLYRTYFGKALGVDEKGSLELVKPFGLSKDKLFTEEIVSDGIKRATELAKKADCAIICIGNDPMIVAREMYDRKTLALPAHDSALAKAVYLANNNCVLTLVSSYPFAICEEQEYMPAIIYTTHAGSELGNAFAEVISGEYSPAGRLAQTWYRSEYELAPIESYDIIENDMTYLYYKGKALYPFGYGLSYAKFEHSDFDVKEHGDTISISLDVKNVSDIDGDEVVQIYYCAENPSVKRPIKQLTAFARVHIGGGQTHCVEFDISKAELRFYDVSRERFAIEQGRYTFMAGASSEDIRLTKTIEVSGEKIPPRELCKGVLAKNYDGKYNTKMKYSKKLEMHYMLGGGLIYNNCVLGNADSMEIVCGSRVNGGKITVSFGGKTLCEAEVKPTVDITRFDTVTAHFDREVLAGIDRDKPATFELSSPEQIYILSFRTY